MDGRSPRGDRLERKIEGVSAVLYAIVAVLSALWMWLRSLGMIAASNLIALVDIAITTWSMVYRSGRER